MSNVFWQFLIGELIVATGAALVSGADSSFIYESLQSVGRKNDYKKVEGKVRGLSQISRAGGKLLGGVIGSISLSFTLFATAISTFISFLIGISFKETKEAIARDEQTSYLEIIKQSVSIVLKNKIILWLVLFFASFNALIWSTWFLSQPYLQLVGIPVVYFGVIFAVINIFSAVSSANLEKLETLIKRPFVFMSIAAVVSLLFLGTFPSLYVIPLWAVFSAFMVINQTLVSHKVLAFVPKDRAATILSFMNLVRRVIYAAFGPILGFVADGWGIPRALQFNGVVLAIVLLIVYLLRKKWAKTKQ